jgi:hypothetical protein
MRLSKESSHPVALTTVNDYLVEHGWSLRGMKGSQRVYTRRMDAGDPFFIIVPFDAGQVSPLHWHSIQSFVKEVEPARRTEAKANGTHPRSKTRKKAS